MGEFKLTADQAEALEQVTEFLHSDESMLTLGGHAGTGKTTLVPYVVEAALELWGKRSVVLTAPTNKAAKVLRQIAEIADLDVRCYTIHKAQGLRLADDDEKKYLVQTGEGELAGVKLIVVDEASMIGTRMFGMIENATAGSGVKVLYVGDPYQLPPVNDGKMQAFTRLRQVRLTQIVRQAKGHPVIELGEFFRQRIDGGKPIQPDGTEVDEPVGVFYMRPADWHARLIAEMKAHALERPGEYRALAFTNNAVDGMVGDIREAIYGPDVPQFMPGERVFTARPFKEMHTDQEATVVEAFPVQKHPTYPKFKAVPVEIETDGRSASMFAYTAANPGEVSRERRRLADAAALAQKNGEGSGHLWKAMHKFVDAFTDLRSVHAMTTHRSQGSTFDSVFVNAPDIAGASRRGGEELKFRLLYVACSRARNRVFIRS
ncbi:MAG: ATP-dependent DNA helicase [Alphaproteobacteria bacterium]